MDREIARRLTALEVRQRPVALRVLPMLVGETAEQALRRHGINPEQPRQQAVLVTARDEAL